MPGWLRGFGPVAVAACGVHVPTEYVHVAPSAGGPTIEKTVPNSTSTWAAPENAMPAPCFEYFGAAAVGSCDHVLPSHCQVSTFDVVSLSSTAITVFVSGSYASDVRTIAGGDLAGFCCVQSPPSQVHVSVSGVAAVPTSCPPNMTMDEVASSYAMLADVRAGGLCDGFSFFHPAVAVHAHVSGIGLPFADPKRTTCA